MSATADRTAAGTRVLDNFIGGAWVDAAGGDTFPTKDPATGVVLQ